MIPLAMNQQLFPSSTFYFGAWELFGSHALELLALQVVLNVYLISLKDFYKKQIYCLSVFDKLYYQTAKSCDF